MFLCGNLKKRQLLFKYKTKESPLKSKELNHGNPENHSNHGIFYL